MAKYTVHIEGKKRWKTLCGVNLSKDKTRQSYWVASTTCPACKTIDKKAQRK
jgi:hypothetical protein